MVLRKGIFDNVPSLASSYSNEGDEGPKSRDDHLHQFWTPWADLTYESGWSNDGWSGTTLPHLRYCTCGKLVWIMGEANNASATGPTTISVLPVGIRPAARTFLSVITANSAQQRVEVYPNGTLYAAAIIGGVPGYYPLIFNNFYRID